MNLFDQIRNVMPVEMDPSIRYYAGLVYSFARSAGGYGSLNCLEVNVTSGWVSSFLAHAVFENNSRYQTDCKYYGLSRQEPSALLEKLKGLPVEFIHCPDGPLDWLRHQTDVIHPRSIHFAFIDGITNYDDLDELVSLVYPLMVAQEGDSYLAIHDAQGACHEVYQRILKDHKFKWEAIRFPTDCGLAVFRKMEEYDYTKKFWRDSDQTICEYFGPENVGYRTFFEKHRQ